MFAIDPQPPLAAAAHAVNRQGWLQAGELSELAAALSELDDVRAVLASDVNAIDE
jgi:hypothetical protein